MILYMGLCWGSPVALCGETTISLANCEAPCQEFPVHHDSLPAPQIKFYLKKCTGLSEIGEPKMDPKYPNLYYRDSAERVRNIFGSSNKSFGLQACIAMPQMVCDAHMPLNLTLQLLYWSASVISRFRLVTPGLLIGC